MTTRVVITHTCARKTTTIKAKWKDAPVINSEHIPKISPSITTQWLIYFKIEHALYCNQCAMIDVASKV
jgi:hypothetical protein